MTSRRQTWIEREAERLVILLQKEALDVATNEAAADWRDGRPASARTWRRAVSRLLKIRGTRPTDDGIAFAVWSLRQDGATYTEATKAVAAACSLSTKRVQNILPEVDKQKK